MSRSESVESEFEIDGDLSRSQAGNDDVFTESVELVELVSA